MYVTLNDVIRAWESGDAQLTLDFAQQCAEGASRVIERARAFHATALALTKLERYEEARRAYDDLISVIDRQYGLPPIAYVLRDERIRVCHLMGDEESRDRFLNDLYNLVNEAMQDHTDEFANLYVDLETGEAEFQGLI